jgi:2-amino-4-hydroxy-6-hydroxymethyldihydropteridine diphosphokinase
MKNIVYIGLGSNMGDKKGQLKQARKMIEDITDVEIIQASSLYLTSPWGNLDQEDFINQVIKISTGLPARDLLNRLQEIEIKMGRQRNVRWGPRTIDLDILLYGDEIIDSPELRVPHPHMRERLFVLIPLQEMNPDLVFPDDGINLREVLVSVLDREENRGIRKI